MLKEYHGYLKEFWRVAELNRWLFVVNLFTATLYKTLAIVQPFVASLIIKALTEQNANAVYQYIVWFFVVYLAYRLARYLDKRAYSWNVNYSYLKMHDKIFNKLVNVDGNFTREIKKGEFMNTINGDLISISEMGDELSEFVATIIQIIIVLIIVGSYSILFTIVILVSLLLYIFIRNRADKRMNYFWWKTRREDDNYSSFIGQIATGLSEVKTFNMLPKLHKRLNKIQNRYDKYYKAQREQITIRDNDVILSYYIFQVLLYIFLIVMFISGRIELSVLILIAAYHETLINYTSDFIDATNEIRLTNASVKRVQKILDYEPEKELKFGHIEIEDLNGKVEFKDISLRLNNKTILSNVSFRVKPHEIVAITGFPGAGKTMLFNILLRLVKPSRGKVLLDDININEFTKEIYTSSVAVANQAPFIFNTSIRNNLDFANTNIKEQIKACKTVGVHDFIETLPQGYNTILRENAANVSSGQKQLISIARTILTDAEVLLFDDITTSLDSKTMAEIPKIIRKLKKDHTIIMITRNPELLGVAERIVVLSDGKVEASGSASTLAKKSKTFRALRYTASVENKNV